MMPVWFAAGNAFASAGDLNPYIRRKFSFSTNTPLEEVSGTLATLAGTARITANKLVLPNDGGYNYMSWPNTTWGANEDFTYEAWINFSSVPSIGGCIVSTWNNGGSGNNGYLLAVYGGVLNFWFTNTSGSQSQLSGTAVSMGANHHVAVTRTAGVFRLFVDGVAAPSTITSQAGCFVSTLATRTVWSNTGSAPVGSIWNIRQLHGKSLYQANFTPPTTI